MAIGIGLRARHLDALLDRTDCGVDFVEITPENWLFDHGAKRKKLEALVERIPTYCHSVSLSVGGLDPFDADFTTALKSFLRRTRAPFFSDHLCYSTYQGRPLHELLPLPFSPSVAEHTAARIVELKERMETPFAIENATYYSVMPGSIMSEADFIRQVLEQSDSSMLLDVNNVYVNAQNHGFDARAFIDSLPLDRVVQLHLAGHTHEDGVIIDTHGAHVVDPVWSLYDYTLQRAGRAIPTLIEWDQDIPELDVLLAEAAKARR